MPRLIYWYECNAYTKTMRKQIYRSDEQSIYISAFVYTHNVSQILHRAYVML